jgi:hypothetical protein
MKETVEMRNLVFSQASIILIKNFIGDSKMAARGRKQKVSLL